MKKIFIIFFLIQSMAGLCQVPVKSTLTDSLIQEFRKSLIRIDSLQNLIESILKRDDSIYNSIINGNYYEQPKTAMDFNYDSIFIDYLDFKNKYNSYLISDKFPKSFPLDSIKRNEIIGYGNKIHPIFKSMKYHQGIDIPAPKGSKIHAPFSGKVILVKKMKRDVGNQLIIQNEDVKIVFSHLDEIFVNEGDLVSKDQIVGTAGSSGLSVANHLHYEILINEVPVNPIFTLFNIFTKEELEQIFVSNCMSLD